MLENISMLNDVANELQAKIDEVRKRIGTIGDNGKLDLLHALPEQIKELNGYLNALKRCEDDAARIIKVVKSHQPEVVNKIKEKMEAMGTMAKMKQPNVQQPKIDTKQTNTKAASANKPETNKNTSTKTTSTDDKSKTTK